ncbi:MAG: PD-(D/E)XK nuclease family protein [Coriobacteriales bacterium]|nr:PD-(D/E)XK nuclease family protein [Coriobacteriales bacterium]
MYFNVHNYNLLFRGVIDRIDYKVDLVEQKVSVRCIDYKTGSIDGLKNKFKFGKLIQHKIYKVAMCSEPLRSEIINKIVEFEDNSTLKSYSYEFDDFIYTFPDVFKSIESKSISKWNVSAEENDKGDVEIKVAHVLSAMNDLKKYPCKSELFAYIYNLDKDAENVSYGVNKDSDGVVELIADEVKSCGYCDYKDLCPMFTGGLYNE